MGEMLVLKPGTAGAMGLARWRNSSHSIAILKDWVGVERNRGEWMDWRGCIEALEVCFVQRSSDPAMVGLGVGPVVANFRPFLSPLSGENCGVSFLCVRHVNAKLTGSS